MPMLINENGDMAVSFADGGQHSFFTHVKETRDGETKIDDGWRRETMMYIGG
jgi:hypothetical protein